MLRIVCLLLTLVALVQGHSCRACDKNACETPTNCRGGIVEDACRCCQVCARQQNESCGGLFGTFGRCDSGLKCVVRPSHGDYLNGHEAGVCRLAEDVTSSDVCQEVMFDGCNLVGRECQCSSARSCLNPFQFPNEEICTKSLQAMESSDKDCSTLKCQVRYAPNCPADSELVESVWPPGECCPLPSTCKCRKTRCKQTLCPNGSERVLVRRATGKPGSCCDRHECRPRKFECNDVICPQTNSNVTCPEDSVKISGRMSKNGCCELSPRCKCKVRSCPRTKCHEGYRPLVSELGTGSPGRCCDVVQCVRATPKGSCNVQGTVYNHGEEFQPEPCLSCRCLDGVHHCSRERCKVLKCERQFTPPGECCPRCKIIMMVRPTTIKPIRICTDESGEAHLPGEEWFRDACTRCTCEEDGPKCIASSCQKNCENPRPVKGECCGVCDEPTYMTIPSSYPCPSMEQCNLTGTECPFGLKTDDLGCRLCQCRSKSEICPTLESCELNCQDGFAVNGVGCEICQCKSRTCKALTSCDKTCPMGFRTDKSGCPRCKCRRCDDVITTCQKKCKFGRKINKFGCEICNCKSSYDPDTSPPVHSRICMDKGKRRDDGEGWTSTGGRQCVCRLGTILCDVIECPVPNCDKPVVKDGSSCDVCPDSPPFKSRVHSCRNRVEGETWEADGCTACVCSGGRVLCTFQECKPAACSDPVYAEGNCCPSCPDEPQSISTSGDSCIGWDGAIHVTGAIWRKDECTSCKCENGKARCFGEKCPQAHNCVNPVMKRGQCCPQCIDKDEDLNLCQLGDRNYTHGEVWVMTSDECALCSCVHSNVFCRKEICRPLPDNCALAVRSLGECCDKCEVFDYYDDEPEEEPAAESNILPIIAGVGGFLVMLLIVGVAAMFIYKRKSKRPKVQYHHGHIVKRQPSVAT